MSGNSERFIKSNCIERFKLLNTALMKDLYDMRNELQKRPNEVLKGFYDIMMSERWIGNVKKSKILSAAMVLTVLKEVCDERGVTL